MEISVVFKGLDRKTFKGVDNVSTLSSINAYILEYEDYSTPTFVNADEVLFIGQRDKIWNAWEKVLDEQS